MDFSLKFSSVRPAIVNFSPLMFFFYWREGLCLKGGTASILEEESRSYATTESLTDLRTQLVV